MRLTKNDNGLYCDTNCICPQSNEIITKLGQLEDIEDTLNFDLVKLFKAIKEGIFIKDYDGEILDLKEDKVYLTFDNVSNFYLDHYTWGAFYLDDYGKTWALTKEELE